MRHRSYHFLQLCSGYHGSLLRTGSLLGGLPSDFPGIESMTTAECDVIRVAGHASSCPSIRLQGVVCSGGL